jgi:hypothetical protein
VTERRAGRFSSSRTRATTTKFTPLRDVDQRTLCAMQEPLTDEHKGHTGQDELQPESDTIEQ